jgi:peptidoglycan/LPS O-acetylase OafA/YrhL
VGVVFLLAGVALVYCGFALVTNHRGFADWFEDAERRRRELTRGGSVWRPERIGSSRRFGAGVLILGFAFLVGGFSSL